MDSDNNTQNIQDNINNNKVMIKSNVVLIIAQTVVIIMGIFVANIWNLIKSSDCDSKLTVYEQTIASLKQTIKDLETQNKDLFIEKDDYKMQFSTIFVSKNKKDKNIQQFTDKYGTVYEGDIDISFWPEIKGKKFVISAGENERIYPLKNIHSLCFNIVEGKALLIITTMEGNTYKHELNSSFYNAREIKFSGKIIQNFKVSEINCIILKQIK